MRFLPPTSFPLCNDTLFPTRRRSITSVLVLATLAILSSQIQLAHSQCTRTSTDTASSSDFLCLMNVTFTRQTDCSGTISETIIFPHTTGEAEQRVIQAIAGVQQVSDIRLQRNRRPVAIRPRLENDGTVKINMPTERTTNPTTFVLSYRISNAVTRFTDGCGRGKPDPTSNVMRWRTGPLDQSVDVLSVQFATNAGRSLSIVGNGGGGRERINIFESNFDQDPDFSIEETGGPVCPTDQVCFTVAMSIWQIVFIAALIGIPVVLTATCCFVFTVCELGGLRKDVEGDGPVSESEMVGFTTGRYSTCIPNDGFGGCECRKERELFDIE